MPKRINYFQVDPQATNGMLQMEKYVSESGLEKKLYELVKIRASQLNSCAYCLDMHTKDARKAGETEQRIYLLSAWRETSFFSDRERAALEWTETLTLLSSNHVSDELYNRMLQFFSEKELVALTMAIVAINGWNRLSVAFGTEAGTYSAD
jgi:AhpD family alkylhydroperoxidase